MDTKIYDAKVKSAGEVDGEFIVEALVAVFGNVDTYGDIVMPGAFTNSLKEWTASGDPIPWIFSHRWEDPFAHLGSIIEAVETPEGLLVKAQIDRENPTAVQVYKLLKARRIKQFSFGYKIRRSVMSDRDGVAVMELHELELLEAGPCLVGVNPATELREVKSSASALETILATKAGQPLSAQQEGIARTAYETLGAHLTAKALTPEDEITAEAIAEPEANAEEPSPANAEELPATAPAHEADAISAKSLDHISNLISIIEIEGSFS